MLPNRRFAPIAMLFVVIFLVACDEVSWRASQAISRGTLAALDECVSRNSSELVGAEIIRDQCVRKHQSVIYRDVIDGKAGTDYGAFRASLTNSSDDTIITKLKIEVTFIGDTPGTVSKEFAGLWILPKASKDLYFGTDDLQGHEVKYDSEAWNFVWNIIRTHGIEIDVD